MTFVRVAATITLGLFGFPLVGLAACCGCKAPGAPTQNICIQTSFDCGELKDKTGNAAIKNLIDCNNQLDASQCRPVDDGVCAVGPVSEGAYAPKSTSATTEPEGKKIDATLKPNVPIPGLEFSQAVVQQGDTLRVPYLAQYVSAIHQYAAGIAITAAAIMILYGGFRYITGSATGNVSRGKEILQDAIIGLLLTLGAYTILTTINPATVSPTTLSLQNIKRSALTDPAAERARVEESARIKPSSQEDVQVPVINLDTPASEPTPTGPETTPPPSGSGAAVGEIAKNPRGDLVAQGDCPVDMIPIVQSDSYPNGKVASFCMDIYEAPNQAGVKPFNGITEREADWYCNERGKRLCSTSEWTRACTGPDGKNAFQYGPKFIPGLIVSAKIKDVGSVVKGADKPAPCNYDSLSPTGSRPEYLANETKFHNLDYDIVKPTNSLLAKGGSDLLKNSGKKELVEYVLRRLSEVSGAEPSGSRPGCMTSEGVFDLSGNLQEIMTTDKGATLTSEQRTNNRNQFVGDNYTWGNFYWSPIAHLANTSAEPACTQRWGKGHGVGWRAMENGFRCCLDLKK